MSRVSAFKSYSWAWVVVCLPESSAVEMSPVRAAWLPSRALVRVDLPMPLCPSRMLVCPSKIGRRMSAFSNALVSTTE